MKIEQSGGGGGNSWFYVVVNFGKKLNADNLEFIFHKLNRYFKERHFTQLSSYYSPPCSKMSEFKCMWLNLFSKA